MRFGRSTPRDPELLRAYNAELRRSARATTLVGGALAVVVLPSWTVFDRLVLPERAATFFVLRIVVTLAIVGVWLALRWSRLGGRWPEQLSFLLVMLPEVGVAWMIPRALSQLEPYLLGLSVAIWASAFLLLWRWQLTALLVAVTGLATAGFLAVVDTRVDAGQLATIGIYLATAGVFATGLSVYRQRVGWDQFVIRAALEEEGRRNELLVAELDQLSREDPLTGVGNRRAWEQRLHIELARAGRSGGTLSVIICDLDHFKAVNDTHGHPVGDRVLCHAATLLLGRVRTADFVARVGGDEFGILCPDLSLAAAERLAESLAQLTRTSSFPERIAVTLSLGVAELRPDDGGADGLMQRADAALYLAKARRDGVRTAVGRRLPAPTR